MVSLQRTRAHPPRKTHFTAEFWEKLAEGLFVTTRCLACRKLSFPPKPFCPHCWHEYVEWTELCGHGRLYSATKIHAVPAVFIREAPITVGIVDLKEGVRIATRMWSPEASELTRGGSADGVTPASLSLDSAVELLVLQFTDGPLFAARLLA